MQDGAEQHRQPNQQGLMEKYSQPASPCDRHERKNERGPCCGNPIRFDLEAHQRRNRDRAQIARELWSFELALPVRKLRLAGLQSPICVEKRERHRDEGVNTRTDLARFAGCVQVNKEDPEKSGEEQQISLQSQRDGFSAETDFKKKEDDDDARKR